MSATATVTVLFCDLVGSTERLSRLGDDAGDEFRRRFFAALRAAIEHHRGIEVKNLGDGVMVVFPTSAVDAIACALEMHELAASLDPHDPALLRVGLSAGEVSHEGDDWFGTPVVEAARLCSAADSGGTLATDVVRALVGSRGTYELASIGDLELKGLPRPVATVSVRRRDEPLTVGPSGAVAAAPITSAAQAPARASTASTPVEEVRASRSRALIGALAALVVVVLVVVALAAGGGGDDPVSTTATQDVAGAPTTESSGDGGIADGSGEDGFDHDVGALSTEPVLHELPPGTESTITFQVGDDERLGLRWLFDDESEQDVHVLLRAEDGTTIADESVVGSTYAGPYDLPGAGEYTLRLTSPSDAADAEVRLLGVPPDLVVQAALDEQVDVVTTVSGQEAHVEFDADAGQRVWIRWTAPGDDARYKFLHLMAPDGVTELLELDALDLGESEWITLAEAGTHTIVVQWPDAGTGFGTVEVRTG